MAKVSNHNIADLVALRLGTTKRQAHEFSREFLQVLLEELASGNDVTLNGIVHFEHVDRGPRRARNPRTGEMVDVPAKTVIKVRNRKNLYHIGDIEYVDLEPEVFEAVQAYRAKAGI